MSEAPQPTYRNTVMPFQMLDYIDGPRKATGAQGALFDARGRKIDDGSDSLKSSAFEASAIAAGQEAWR